MQLGETLDEAGLEHGELGVIGARVGVRGEVLDEREIADEVQDDIDDLHIAFLPLLRVAGEAGQRNRKSACKTPGRSKAVL